MGNICCDASDSAPEGTEMTNSKKKMILRNHGVDTRTYTGKVYHAIINLHQDPKSHIN